jgi:antitoxin HicB
MSNLVLERCGSNDQHIEWSNWDVLGDRTYQCRVLLCPESEGGFSAHAIRLPGVVSEGDTEAEALANVADAFQAVIQTFLDENRPIPWQDSEIERPKGSRERWILVNV